MLYDTFQSARHPRSARSHGGIYIPVIHVLWTHLWCGGATGKAFGLAISRSRVQILLEATLHNNLRQVVYTYVPL